MDRSPSTARTWGQSLTERYIQGMRMVVARRPVTSLQNYPQVIVQSGHSAHTSALPRAPTVVSGGVQDDPVRPRGALRCTTVIHCSTKRGDHHGDDPQDAVRDDAGPGRLPVRQGAHGGLHQGHEEAGEEADEAHEEAGEAQPAARPVTSSPEGPSPVLGGGLFAVSDVGAHAGLRPERAIVDERDEGLAHGAGGDVELPREGDGGWDRLAGRVGAVLHPLADDLGHLWPHGTAPVDLDLHDRTVRRCTMGPRSENGALRVATVRSWRDTVQA
ncbi:hypothetical protein KGG73_gp43 [Streptomyces phage Sentinel]|uniref:Uncharacterized protein n=1 Tax=Streptomyces phage Sentinel TaxID=2767584 RepID=A0A873WEF3_9CAUD|nr:hypothetical protein KGG73_gp43 [Streptomyces phage Sentinel]QPB09877.1 hypothetical protein CPT_Sentinel_043 [Streptomyces phage Sentinel]